MIFHLKAFHREVFISVLCILCMRRSTRSGLLGSGSLVLLPLVSLVRGPSTYNRETGYVPSDLDSLLCWSDGKLHRELYTIQTLPGIWKGDETYTLSQREAYSLIRREVDRREMIERD